MPSSVFVSLQPDGEVNCSAQPRVATRLQRRVAVAAVGSLERERRRAGRPRAALCPGVALLPRPDPECGGWPLLSRWARGCPWLQEVPGLGLWVLFAVRLGKQSGVCGELVSPGKWWENPNSRCARRALFLLLPPGLPAGTAACVPRAALLSCLAGLDARCGQVAQLEGRAQQRWWWLLMVREDLA